jgi:maltose alpha-D-glucosyltransferase/alpha-amylase
VINGQHSRAQSDGAHRIELEAYAWRWYRVGGPDNTLDRTDLSIMPKPSR